MDPTRQGKNFPGTTPLIKNRSGKTPLTKNSDGDSDVEMKDVYVHVEDESNHGSKENKKTKNKNKKRDQESSSLSSDIDSSDSDPENGSGAQTPLLDKDGKPIPMSDVGDEAKNSKLVKADFPFNQASISSSDRILTPEEKKAAKKLLKKQEKIDLKEKVKKLNRQLKESEKKKELYKSRAWEDENEWGYDWAADVISAISQKDASYAQKNFSVFKLQPTVLRRLVCKNQSIIQQCV